jgi:hypothetical protein
MHLTNSKKPGQTEIIELTDEQVKAFFSYVTQEGTHPPAKALSAPLPFRVPSDARRLTVGEAVSAKIYRDYGQLSQQWESDRRYEKTRTLGWRADGTRGCVYMGPGPAKGPD